MHMRCAFDTCGLSVRCTGVYFTFEGLSIVLEYGPNRTKDLKFMLKLALSDTGMVSVVHNTHKPRIE